MKNNITEILDLIEENNIDNLSDLYKFHEKGRNEEIEELEKSNEDIDENKLFYNFEKITDILMYPRFFAEVLKEQKYMKIKNSGKKLIEKTYSIED